MRRTAWLAILVLFLTTLASGVATGQGEKDVVVTDQDYLRHDGGTDNGIESCGSDATTPEAGGDAGGNAQQNEPSVAINPSDPDVIVAGANDYCTVSTSGDAWMGFYVSLNGGETWVNSLNPGYPTDTSEEGQDSPIFGRAGAAGDPIQDWDNDNRLFYGGISFNRTQPNPGGITPTNGDVIVSTWVRDESPESPLGMDYLRTVIVGEGTPSAFFFGRFNDKPSLRVDDWEGSLHEGNVYVSWTLFPGGGRDQILFSRSTDHGVSFSKPIKISERIANAQGSDIAVAPDGTVYVVWREFADVSQGVDNAIVFVKSTDGGESFSSPRRITEIVPYDRSDVSAVTGNPARDCGDGPFLCVSEFVFHRVATLPQAVVDGDGNLHVTWEELIPAEDNGDTYRPDGQAQIVVTTSTDGGATFSDSIFLDEQDKGHQWWPNLEYDRSTDMLVAVYYDSRADLVHFSVNRPTGNTAAATNSGDVLNTFMATSEDGASWDSVLVSSEGHQPNYEMFGDRNIPFHGDYLWIDANGGTVFGVWTDNRDVVPGGDPREEEPQDGFDVEQCRVEQDDGTFGPDNCPNAGGLNQNIYGAPLG